MISSFLVGKDVGILVGMLHGIVWMVLVMDVVMECIVPCSCMDVVSSVFLFMASPCTPVNFLADLLDLVEEVDFQHFEKVVFQTSYLSDFDAFFLRFASSNILKELYF